MPRQCWRCGQKFELKKKLTEHLKSNYSLCWRDRVVRYRRVKAQKNKNKLLQQFFRSIKLNAFEIQKEIVDDVIKEILNHEKNEDFYETEANPEGSFKTGLKVGKADEFDFSVGVNVSPKRKVSRSQGVEFQYVKDDIDEDSTIRTRKLRERDYEFGDEVHPPVGYRVISLARKQTKSLKHSVIDDILVPYEVLMHFHEYVHEVVKEIDDDNRITVSKRARGPAITLTIRDGRVNHKISVDITPVIYFKNHSTWINDRCEWPRDSTEDWLTESKITKVQNTKLYLVPKGDKFWKVSFARLEDSLLEDFDDEDEIRKTCLQIAKGKLAKWKAESDGGMKTISSYLLKTVLLWMCELLPNDGDWVSDKLAARYTNFMTELRHCLKTRYLGEYFLPESNLLERKDQDDIDEMIDFIDEELKSVR